LPFQIEKMGWMMHGAPLPRPLLRLVGYALPSPSKCNVGEVMRELKSIQTGRDSSLRREFSMTINFTIWPAYLEKFLSVDGFIRF
jgi:hypothetical protein